jgi:pimeloyl-ACP methyl ester carboxylesterase
MPIAEIDGIPTRYEVIGEGPPVLMYAPGGFDATIEKWSDQSVYAKIRLLDALPKQFRCIVFDRRECGASGGRVEAVTWRHFVAQGRGLMDHLGIARAHLIGGCMGVCPVVAFATEHPERVAGMVLYWPVGGAKYRINGQLRFARHLAYLEEHGLKGVVALAQASADSFGRDPRGGPWRGVIHRDPAFAEAVAGMDPERYRLAVIGMQRALNDRDTGPGAEPEAMLCCDVPALIVPGSDASHATSAARYLGECLPRADYWDVAVAGQTAETVQPRVLEFLSRHG